MTLTPITVGMKNTAKAIDDNFKELSAPYAASVTTKGIVLKFKRRGNTVNIQIEGQTTAAIANSEKVSNLIPAEYVPAGTVHFHFGKPGDTSVNYQLDIGTDRSISFFGAIPNGTYTRGSTIYFLD